MLCNIYTYSCPPNQRAFKKRTISQAANRNTPTPKLAVEPASTTCPGTAFSPIGCI